MEIWGNTDTIIINWVRWNKSTHIYVSCHRYLATAHPVQITDSMYLLQGVSDTWSIVFLINLFSLLKILVCDTHSVCQVLPTAQFVSSEILSVVHFVFVSYSLSSYKSIGSDSTSNSNTQWSQQYACIETIPVWVWPDGGEQPTFKKYWVSLRCVYACAVNSTKTQHSNCFIWKVTASQRVVRRYDKTSWQGANESVCTKTILFLRDFCNKKNCQKNRNAFFDALLTFRSQSFAAGAAKQKRGFWIRTLHH